MAVYTSWKDIENTLGDDFNQTYPSPQGPVAASVLSTGNIEQANYPEIPLGTWRQGDKFSEWVLVKASTTITAYNVVVWDDAYNANNLTSALALTGLAMGIAQFNQAPGGIAIVSADPSTNPVFWAAVRGVGMQVNVSGSAGTGTIVNNAAAPGEVETINVTASASGQQILGIMIYASQTSGLNATQVECSVLYPHLAVL
jgi:hypothetical protein